MDRKISKYFWRSEMLCKCGKCGMDTMDGETLMIADVVREFVGHSIAPSSANRCPWWNGKEGGGYSSQHLLSRALDLPVKNPKEVYDMLCEKFPGKYGFGWYDSPDPDKRFVHVDSRTPEARWKG